jgi:hypothetical protein
MARERVMHSDGEWVADVCNVGQPDEHVVVTAYPDTADGTEIVDICEIAEFTDLKYALANGRLIAAAPQLLAACETALEDARMALSDEWDRSDGGFEAQIEMLERVIRLARQGR